MNPSARRRSAGEGRLQRHRPNENCRDLARNNDAFLFLYADESFPDAATIAHGHMYMTSGLSVYVFRKQ